MPYQPYARCFSFGSLQALTIYSSPLWQFYPCIVLHVSSLSFVFPPLTHCTCKHCAFLQQRRYRYGFSPILYMCTNITFGNVIKDALWNSAAFGYIELISKTSLFDINVLNPHILFLWHHLAPRCFLVYPRTRILVFLPGTRLRYPFTFSSCICYTS